MRIFKRFFSFFSFLRNFVLVSFSKEFRHTIFEITNDVKLLKNLIYSQKKKNKNECFTFSNFHPLTFRYLITTNKGIYLLEKNNIFKIYNGDVHGICSFKNQIFFSVFTGRHSSILKADINYKTKYLSNFDRLISFETRYNNERIHGMCFNQNSKSLLIANTKRNSILLYDYKKKKILNEIFVMSDKTNFKILCDHNHLNNVSIYNNKILFTCHNGSIGKKSRGGSLVGFIEKNKIYFYEYKNRGVHDIILHNDNLIINDSFGDLNKNPAGPILNGKIFKKKFF